MAREHSGIGGKERRTRPTIERPLTLADLRPGGEVDDFILREARAKCIRMDLPEADAEEIAGTVKAELAKKIQGGTAEPIRNWQALAKRMCSDRTIDKVRYNDRRGGKNSHRDIDDPALHLAGPDDGGAEGAVARKDALAKVESKLVRLPRDIQPVIRLTLKGKDEEEIAEALRLDVEDVKAKIAEGQRRLRAILVGETDSGGQADQEEMESAEQAA